MATYLAQLMYPDNRNSSSQIGQWITGFNTALTTIGLVQASDTGQISTTSPGTNSSQDTITGYQIWKFADSLQSTYPVFIKFSYGCGTNAASSQTCALWVAIGSGTDGAGNLTGQKMTGNGFEMSPYSSNYGFKYNSYFSGGTNRITFSLFDDPQINEEFFCSIERTHDSNGNDTTDGALLYVHSNRSGPAHCVVPWTGSVPATQYGWAAAISRNGSAQNIDGTVSFALPIPFGLQPYNPPLGCAVYQATDIGVYTQISIPVYGTNANYLALNRIGYVVPRQEQGYNNNNNPNDYSGGTHILMRYQ